MQYLLDLLNKLFGLGGKAQVFILVVTHLIAIVFGIILGMAFAKPTIIVNDEKNKPPIIRESETMPESGAMSSSSSNNTAWKNNEYRTQLLQLMPPSPTI